MSAKVILRGQVAAVNPLLDPASKSPTGLYVAQFVKRNGRNAVELLNVKLYEGADPARYAEGTHVELVVDITTFRNAVHYRATRDLRDGHADLCGMERVTAAPGSQT